MKAKGKISVRKAVEVVYPQLQKRFSLAGLHALVVRETCRPYLHMDTTRRKAMELREEGVIHFHNVDKARSLYERDDIMY